MQRTRQIAYIKHRTVRLGRRGGFSMIEILVSLGVIGVLATAVLVVTSRSALLASAESRALEAALDLDELARAIAFFEPTKPPTSFKQTVGVYPGKLSHLVNAITTGQRTDCNVFYSNPQTNAWLGNYYGSNIPPTGLKLAEGYVTQDSLERVPANINTLPAGVLNIVLPSVARADAAALALAADGDSTGTVGAVRYTAAGNAPVKVRYRIEIGGC